VNPQLNYFAAQEHMADLRAAADSARWAGEARAQRRKSRRADRIARASVELVRLTARLVPRRGSRAARIGP
jgi:hypothetical protein